MLLCNAKNGQIRSKDSKTDHTPCTYMISGGTSHVLNGLCFHKTLIIGLNKELPDELPQIHTD